METLISLFKGTPWWVYVIFVYLLRVGIKALKPHMISVNKMFIIPLIFIAWGIYSLIAKFKGWPDLFFLAVAGVGGFFIGASLEKRVKKMRADRKKLLAYVPGSPVILILVLLIFPIKYFFGYYRATHSEQSSSIHVANLLASGAFMGIFIGRARAFLLQFTKTKHESLKKGTIPRKKPLL